jgi:peptidoglycan/xylan/chitin deacetylase (PgdA/CDA1 family)
LATGQLIRGLFGLRGVPVFLYHGLTRSSGPPCAMRERKYWVSATRFRDHLALLRRKGRQVVLLRELWNSTEVCKRQNFRVVLTFDDGNLSDYEIAFPLLLEAGYQAEFFVNTATVGTKGFLSWQQIGEMQRGGMSFQSHSHGHVNLTRLPPAELERQLNLSMQILNDRLGLAVDFLAVPFGVLNETVVETALCLGYRAVCTARSLPARPQTPRINRIVVYQHTTLSHFSQLADRSPLRFLTLAARAAFQWPAYQVLRFRRSQADAKLPGETA